MTPKLYNEALDGFRGALSAASVGMSVLGVGMKPRSSLMLGLYCSTEDARDADFTCTTLNVSATGQSRSRFGQGFSAADAGMSWGWA